MGMPFKDDAEHVPDFALVPVRRRPDIHNTIEGGMLACEGDFESNVPVALERQEVIDDGEIARRLAFPMGAHALVNRREVVQHPVGLGNLVLQVTQNIPRLVARGP
jgi:hypothetical protein